MEFVNSEEFAGFDFFTDIVSDGKTENEENSSKLSPTATLLGMNSPPPSSSLLPSPINFPQQSSRGLSDMEVITNHLVVLDHTSSCINKRCPKNECTQMKAFIRHVTNCKQGDRCRLCLRFFHLCRMHARLCTREFGHCPVLYCNKFKLNIM